MKKLRVIARNSPLSLKQVEEVFSQLGVNLDYELIPVLSYGDKHKDISLMDDVPEDFFTRELDEAILSGSADVAIHSAKDLPFLLREGIRLAALTKGRTSKDALVSRNNLKLMELPAKSKIGLSSHLRKENVKKLREDLEIVPIRGTIEERLSLVDSGVVDAIIVAACALERLNLTYRISEILPFETHPLQGKLAVTIASGKPHLRKLFFEIDERKDYGKVFIVGAGAGDIQLLTIKAKKCLEFVDVILYDDLVNPEILKFAKEDCKKIYVGKREGRHSTTQEEILKLLYIYATEGKNVARLKGGEPLIFGRAQEEIDFLKRRFLTVEVINGISSAFAAGSSLCLSLSNREAGSRVILESGHIGGDEYKDKVSSHIFYMGASSKDKIYLKLKSLYGKDIRVALVKNASIPEEEIRIINLRDLPAQNLTSPLIIIAGDIVKFFSKEERILYTGIDPFETLCKINGSIVHYPLISRERILSFPEIDFSNFDVIVFTSQFGVNVFTDYYGVIKKKKIYAIGQKTKESLLKRGYESIIIPESFDSESLASLLVQNESEAKILYVCSTRSINKISYLKNVTPFTAYKTIFVEQKRLNLTLFDGIYFASPGCVEAFVKIYGEIPFHLILYAGGLMTFKALEKLNLSDRTIMLAKS